MLPENVRAERTGWRDQKISERHRSWGFNCPAVDLDFLVVEYNVGKPVALVEYKHFRARKPVIDHPTYRAIKFLADGHNEGPLPFMVSFYWPECWAFRVYPINEIARQHFTEGEAVTEREYVSRLYRMRRLKLTQTISDLLLDDLPPAAVVEDIL